MTSPALLVVDDDLRVQSLLEDTFAEAGYAVTTAASGVQAIGLLEASAVRPDGLIIDLRLGRGPSGWEVARRACELRPDLAVVYITGGRGRDTQPRGAPDGVMLLKPFTRDQMLTVVAALLAA
jgi:DNA-binding response OmpR family regulator